MAITIQLRRDLSSNWSSNNPVLESGEIGVATDENKIKVGDGSTLWNSLSYINPESPTFTNLTVSGDLTVNGSSTTINSTTLTVDDKNIELASVASPTDITADGGGITVKGATDKTFNWVNSTGAWTSSEGLDLVSGKEFKINGTSILSSSELGSGVTSSSLTSVGVISSGTWEATDVALAHGGTNASLSASEGGIIYSTSSAMAITSAGNAGQVLTSNGSSAPTWNDVDAGFNGFLLAGM